MKISKDTVVTLQYKLSDAQGNLIEESNEPMVYLHGGYNNTLPKIEEAKVMAKTAGARGSIGDFRRCFWAYYLARHPNEGDQRKPYGAISRWRELPDLKLVVAQYLALDGPGVFIRSARGGDDEAVVELLDPHQRELRGRLGIGIGSSSRFGARRRAM